jgi:hypothetical protein
LTIAIVAFVFAMSRPVFAATTAPTLGTASTFAVLAATTVTNTGPTVITGDLGVSPGTACTGLPSPCTGNGPGVVTGGTIHTGADAVAVQAQKDLVTAYNALKAMQCGTNLSGKILGTDVTTLSSGVYCFDTTAQLTGTLHLSGTVIFQIGTALTTASNSFVIVDDNSGCGGNVFWEMGSAATLGTGTTFAGNLLANTAITLTTGATVSGRALDVTAAVTMDTNHVSACGAGLPAGGPGTCGENNETGDTNHHHNDKGETRDNDRHNENGKHVGNNSLRDQARSNHDTDDSHGHHSEGKGHNDKDDCAKNNDNENHNNNDTDDRTDNAKDNNHD